VNDIAGVRRAPDRALTQAAAAELFTAISVIRRTARRAARNAWALQPLPPAQSELLRLAAARPGLTVAMPPRNCGWRRTRSARWWGG
jgi:hypothetical protein